MKSTKRRNESKDYWVGLDVSKQTFDAALAGPEQRFPSTPVRALPWKAFPRTREGVVAFLAWLDEQVLKRRARVVMEATGKYSDLPPSLVPGLLRGFPFVNLRCFVVPNQA